MSRVLIIDDENDILEIITLSLETVGGFQVTACSNAVDGISAAQESEPDMILLDVMMPDIDGPETLKRLKALPTLQDTPVVFMTARVQPTEKEEYLELGAVAVIEKPFDPMALPGMVAAIYSQNK